MDSYYKFFNGFTYKNVNFVINNMKYIGKEIKVKSLYL